jgi:succinyl-diaminopimelate desuccinylase
MSTLQRLLSRVEGYREQMVQAQRELVAVPALGPTNGGQGELAKAELVQGWLEELGMAVERVDAPDERVASGLRPNLVARLAGGGGPRVWALSHLDVVPPGPADQWDSDPWELRVEGDTLYGRGVLDNHAGLVSSFFGLKAVAEEGLSLPGDAGLMVVADEETGSAYGLDYLLSRRPELVGESDLIVVPDAGDDEGLRIEVAEKSILWLKVEVAGRQVHGSTPERGVNALYASARMMVAVREMYRRFPQTDGLYSPPGSTFEPTRKEAGVPNVNTVPGRDVFYVDCRVLPQIALEEVEEAFIGRCREIAAEEGASVEVSAVQRLQAPPPTPADAPVARALERAVHRVTGSRPTIGGIGGGTVAAFFRGHGLPAAVWGTWPDSAHMPNEYCSTDALVKDAKVFALLFAGEC